MAMHVVISLSFSYEGCFDSNCGVVSEFRPAVLPSEHETPSLRNISRHEKTLAYTRVNRGPHTVLIQSYSPGMVILVVRILALFGVVKPTCWIYFSLGGGAAYGQETGQ